MSRDKGGDGVQEVMSSILIGCTNPLRTTNVGRKAAFSFGVRRPSPRRRDARPGLPVTATTEALRNDPVRSRDILARIPAGTPDDLKGDVFFASRASEYVHGSVLVVDGGWLAR